MTENMNSTEHQTQPEAGPDIDAERASDTHVCPRCSSINKGKRCIRCNVCRRHWHLTCAHLTRAQADSLGCWWCPTCISNTSNNSQVPNSVLVTLDASLPLSLNQPSHRLPLSHSHTSRRLHQLPVGTWPCIWPD